MDVCTLQNHLQPASNHFQPAPTSPKIPKLPPTTHNQPQTASATPNHLQQPPINRQSTLFSPNHPQPETFKQK